MMIAPAFALVSVPWVMSAQCRFLTARQGESRRKLLQVPVRSETIWANWRGRRGRAPQNLVGCRNGIAGPPSCPGTPAGSPSVRDGTGDRARHRAAVAVAGIFLCQRIAVAFGAARRSGGAERAW